MSALITAVCATWLGVELLRQALAWAVLRRQSRTAPRAASDPHFGGVDVLQAVRSGDPQLAATLSAVLIELGRRGARLHWLLDDDDAVAQQVVQRLLGDHPRWAEQVTLSTHPPCPERLNPKLFKLDRALASCTGSVVLVLDDRDRHG